MQSLMKKLRCLNDKERMVARTQNPEELEIHDFKDFRTITTGSYSEVIYVRSKAPPHQHYAIKKIDKEILKKKNLIPIIQHEINVLYTLDHPNVVKMHDHFEDKKCIYLLLDYYNSETLKSEMQRQKGKVLTEGQCLLWLRQMIDALEYIHSKNLIHRDINCDNFLLQKDDPKRNATVKLCDFGSSRYAVKSEKGLSLSGKLEYMPPEMLKLGEQTLKIDIWQLGVVIFKLLTGKTPFDCTLKDSKQRQVAIKESIINARCEFPQGFPEGAADLILGTLLLKPEQRFTIDEVKQHWWVNGYQTKPQQSLPQLINHIMKTNSYSIQFEVSDPIEKKLSIQPSTQNFFITDTEIEAFQKERVIRRSQLYSDKQKEQIASLQVPKRGQSDSGSSSSSSDNEKAGKKKKRPIKRLSQINEEYFQQHDSQKQMEKFQLSPQMKDRRSDLSTKANEEIEEEKLDQQREPPKISISDAQFDRQGFNQKGQAPIDPQLKQSQQAPKTEDYRSQVKQKMEGLQNTRCQQKIDNPFQLYENEEQKLKNVMENLVKQLSDLQVQTRQIKQTLLDKSSYNSSGSTIMQGDDQPFMRQSSVNYENYDSEAKQSYYRLLVQKMPILKSEKFCIKSCLQEQLSQTQAIAKASDQLHDLEEEQQSLAQKKSQMIEIAEILRKQIKEITDKKTYMFLEINQIQTQERIEHQMEELEKKYSHDFKDNNLKSLTDFSQSLDEFQNHINQKIHKSQSLLQDQNMSILEGLSPSLGEESFLSMGASQKMSISNEMQRALDKQQQCLDKKYANKMNKLDQEYNCHKSKQDQQIQQYLEENAKLKIVRGRGVNLDERVLAPQVRVKQLQDAIKGNSELENRLLIDLEVQQGQIVFITAEISKLKPRFQHK